MPYKTCTLLARKNIGKVKRHVDTVCSLYLERERASSYFATTGRRQVGTGLVSTVVVFSKHLVNLGLTEQRDKFSIFVDFSSEGWRSVLCAGQSIVPCSSGCWEQSIRHHHWQLPWTVTTGTMTVWAWVLWKYGEVDNKQGTRSVSLIMLGEAEWISTGESREPISFVDPKCGYLMLSTQRDAPFQVSSPLVWTSYSDAARVQICVYSKQQ